MSKLTIIGTAPNQIAVMTNDGSFLFTHDLDQFDRPHFIIEVTAGGQAAEGNARIKAAYNHPDFDFEVLSSGDFVTSVLSGGMAKQARVIGKTNHVFVQLYSHERFVESLSPIKY